MDNLDHQIEILPLNGTDLDCLNAIVNAVRSSTFTTFCERFKEDLPMFFKKCFITTENDTKDLSIACKTMDLVSLKQVWLYVFKQRQEELQGLFEEKEVSYNELADLAKIKYQLLYLYGDKIGGYPAVASLNIEETLNIYKFFTEIQTQQNEAIKKEVNKQEVNK